MKGQRPLVQLIMNGSVMDFIYRYIITLGVNFVYINKTKTCVKLVLLFHKKIYP